MYMYMHIQQLKYTQYMYIHTVEQSSIQMYMHYTVFVLHACMYALIAGMTVQIIAMWRWDTLQLVSLSSCEVYSVYLTLTD